MLGHMRKKCLVAQLTIPARCVGILHILSIASCVADHINKIEKLFKIH